jgi:hypothetical protein
LSGSSVAALEQVSAGKQPPEFPVPAPGIFPMLGPEPSLVPLQLSPVLSP